MINQQNIADELGISRTLVSKVLRGKLGTTRAKPETIQAIWETARKLGYKPNSTAVSLATGKQGAIGVCIRRFGNLASRLADDIADGIIAAAAASGQKLMLIYYTENGTNHGTASFEPLLTHGALDGLIFAGFLPMDALDMLMGFNDLPIVFVRSDANIRPDCLHTLTNEPRMSEIATDHLIERGCRNIAYIRGDTERYLGYIKSLESHNIDINPRLIVNAIEILPERMFSYAAGKNALDKLLATGVKFDALVAESDEQAIAVLNELIKRGIRVPEDVKITGIDNSPQCEFSICPLTSVDQNLREAGRRGFEMLLENIAAPQAIITDLVIDPVLIPRQSTR